MNNNVALVTVAAIVLSAGCGSTKAKKSDLPAISADNTPFIRITEVARKDLELAAIERRPTPTREVIESVIKRQRVVGTETLAKGNLYIPDLIDGNDPASIVTVSSGVEDWALIRTSLWDEVRNKPFITQGFIPLYEYKRHLQKAVKRNEKRN